MPVILDYKFIFGIISILFSLYSYYIYYKSVFEGKSKPHIFSWFLWGFISLVIGLIQFSNGGGFGVMNTFLVSLGCLGISVLSYRNGDHEITKSDILFLGFGIISVCIWIFVNLPIYSLVILIIIDICGFIPTFRMLYKKPHNEHIEAYFLAACGYSASIVSLGDISFITSGYIASTAFLNISLCVMTYIRRKQKKSKKLS